MTREELENIRYDSGELISAAYETDCYEITDRLYSNYDIAEIMSNSIASGDYYSWHDIASRFNDIEESPYDMYYQDDYGEISPITDSDSEWLYGDLYDHLDGGGYFDDDDNSDNVDGGMMFDDDPHDTEFIRSDDQDEDLICMMESVRPIETLLAI